MRVAFRNRKHDLNLSTYALVILLQFESLGAEDFLTYEVRLLALLPNFLNLISIQELKAATSIPDVELSRNLQSLACAKSKILKKHPQGRNVDPDDSFSFNEEFSSPLMRIKISTISAKVESTGERRETRDKVDEERKFQIEVRRPKRLV